MTMLRNASILAAVVLFTLSSCGVGDANLNEQGDETSADLALSARPLTGAGANTCALDGVYQCAMRRPQPKTSQLELRHTGGCVMPYDITVTQNFVSQSLVPYTRTVSRLSTAADTAMSFCVTGTQSSCIGVAITEQGGNMLREFYASPYASLRTLDVLYWVDAQGQLQVQGHTSRHSVEGTCQRIAP